MFPISYMTVLAILGGLLCLGSTAVLLICESYSDKLDTRLRDLPGPAGRGPIGSERSRQRTPSDAPREGASSPVTGNRRAAENKEGHKQRQSQLIQAGIYNPNALLAFFVARTGLTIIPPMLGVIAAASGAATPRIALWWSASFGFAGIILPTLWLESKIRRRHNILRQSLADFLDLMIVCLQSGVSLQGTVQCVSDELRIAHPEFAGELNIVQRDISLGVTVDASLRRFAVRSGCDGVGALAKFVREAQRLGTQLTEALRLHADMLRTQRENAAEETAQKAAVKILIPTLFLILPAVFIVLAGPAVIQIQQVFAK
jgi:tight adherence protein C